MPTVFLLDVARRRLEPVRLERRAAGGFSAEFLFPGGQRCFIGVPHGGDLPLDSMFAEIGEDGQVISLQQRVRGNKRVFEYSPQSPPGFGVTVEQPMTDGEGVYRRLVSVTHIPEGDPERFRPEAVAVLLEALRDEQRKREESEQQKEREKLETLRASHARPDASPPLKPNWWLIGTGFAMVAAGGIALVRRRMG